MTLRSRLRFAAACGLALGLVRPGLAGEPAPAAPQPLAIAPIASQPTGNQQLANAIVSHLNGSGRLRNYTVDVAVRGGLVELSGVVADQPQREEVLRLVQGMPGVERVIDRMTLPGASAITRVQAPPVPAVEAPPKAPGAGSPPGKLPEPLPDQAGPVPPGAPGAVPGAPGAVPGNGIAEPVPVFRAPAPHPYDLGNPRMPPYAWPTYAPYNNYSRVAVPEAYPYNAWPFIGPVHPFPKIPLGWRSVKLEWDDGYWWFSRVATKYDWWRLRYK